MSLWMDENGQWIEAPQWSLSPSNGTHMVDETILTSYPLVSQHLPQHVAQKHAHGFNCFLFP